MPQLEQDELQLVVIDERERIADELLAPVIHRLSRAGMELLSLQQRLETEAEVSGRIDRTIALIDEAIQEIRRVVFHDKGEEPLAWDRSGNERS